MIQKHEAEAAETAFRDWLGSSGRLIFGQEYHPDRFAFHAGYMAAIAKAAESTEVGPEAPKG